LKANIVELQKIMPELPAFGMVMNIHDSFNKLIWYGRGPMENYSDRNFAAHVDLYESDVSQQYFPYIRPQETGYKTDVKWLVLKNNSGTGLMVVADSLIGFSSLNYSIWKLDEGLKKTNRHTVDIKPDDFITLRVDYGQTGLGGDNSWGARAYPQYTLKYKDYLYSYTIKPVYNTSQNLFLLSRKH